MAKGGYDETNLPKTREGVVQAWPRLRAASVDNPLFRAWETTGIWVYLTPMWLQDKATVTGADFRFETPEGLTAVTTMTETFTGCEMQPPEWMVVHLASDDLAQLAAAWAWPEFIPSSWSDWGAFTLSAPEGNKAPIRRDLSAF